MRLSSKPIISVDIDYQKSIPIEDVASRLGMSFNRSKFSYCPDPNCPDNNSKNRGAHINTKNNTIHCFVCGGTWNSFTLAGLKQFGYDNDQCFTREGIVAVGKFIADDLGYGGAKELKQNTKPAYPKMPDVVFYPTYGMREKAQHIPLWRAIGLKRNPFLSTTVSVKKENAGTDMTENVSLPTSSAALMMSMKCMEQLHNIYDFFARTDAFDASARFIKDLRYEVKTICSYTKELSPLLDTEGKKTLSQELLYQLVMTDDNDYRRALQLAFPDEAKPLIENLKQLYKSDPSLSEDNEYEKGGDDNYDVER